MHLIFASVLSIAVQAALIVHVIRSGRNSLWIWAIALLPPAGPLAYVVVELLPDLLGGATARRARTGVTRMLDPDRELRRVTTEVEVSGNVDARRRLAEELLARGRQTAAAEVSAAGLRGVFEHDPTLLLVLARAQFALQDFAAARASLERLTRHNPEFQSPEVQLLHARALEAGGELRAAEREYAAVAPGYPGAEARVRQALLLQRLGETESARRILRELLDAARLGPAHYRRAQAKWLERARRALD